MEELLSAWSLFASSWISAWILAPLLAIVGIAVVARGAIFQGVATAQAATAAIATMLVLAQSIPWFGTPWAIAGASLLVATSTSVIALQGRSSEAMNGWLFLTAGAATPLLLSYSPHGLTDVQRLVTSSLIGASWSDAMVFSVILIGILLMLICCGSRIRLVLLDREAATEMGLSVSRWQFLIGVTAGLVIGLGLRSAGLLFIAGCLLLPVLAAIQCCRTTAAVAWCAPLLALLSAILGTFFAHEYDLPLGQVVVALLALWCAGALVLG
jgi:ABC-type Mn2+/Zn2+ transport system permease subunit